MRQWVFDAFGLGSYASRMLAKAPAMILCETHPPGLRAGDGAQEEDAVRRSTTLKWLSITIDRSLSRQSVHRFFDVRNRGRHELEASWTFRANGLPAACAIVHVGCAGRTWTVSAYCRPELPSEPVRREGFGRQSRQRRRPGKITATATWMERLVAVCGLLCCIHACMGRGFRHQPYSALRQGSLRRPCTRPRAKALPAYLFVRPCGRPQPGDLG